MAYFRFRRSTEVKPLFTEVKVLFTEVKPRFTEVKSFFTEVKSLFTEVKPRFTEVRSRLWNGRLKGVERKALRGLSPCDPCFSRAGLVLRAPRARPKKTTYFFRFQRTERRT